MWPIRLIARSLLRSGEGTGSQSFVDVVNGVGHSRPATLVAKERVQCGGQSEYAEGVVHVDPMQVPCKCTLTGPAIAGAGDDVRAARDPRSSHPRGEPRVDLGVVGVQLEPGAAVVRAEGSLCVDVS